MATTNTELTELMILSRRQTFVESMRRLVSKGMRIENIVLNAGILKYPNVGRLCLCNTSDG